MAAWSSPALPILWEPKLWVGQSQRACAPFPSFFSVLGWLFSMFKCNFFAISFSCSKLVSGEALDGPILPWLCCCRQLRRHFAPGAFFFFPHGRVLPGELPINYVDGKWDLKAAGINN